MTNPNAEVLHHPKGNGLPKARSRRLPILDSPDLKPMASEPSVALKPSLYNVFVDRGEFVWAFNTRSTAFARLEKEQYRAAKALMDDPGHAEADEDSSLRDDLVKGQFLIPDSLDEKAFLKIKNRVTRFSSKGLGLIIAPTLRCNFGCEYCYVDLNANKMSSDTREKVKLFFEDKLQRNSKASVCWTGGDPSLCMDVVQELSEHFIETCKAKESEYDAVLITNGYLLDEKMLAALHASQIQAIQITLDGHREYHNARRFLVKGDPTYDVILDNMKRACREMQINLRINIDRGNYKSAAQIFDDLDERGLKGHIYVYFAHVEAVNDNCSSYDDKCLSTHEYAKVEPELMRMALSRGFEISGTVIKQSRGQFCGANSYNHWVIDSNAQLLKCYNDLGTADVNGIGYIDKDGEEIIDKEHNWTKWLGWDPFAIEECSSCKVLPLCMGGCSYQIINNDMNVEKGCLKLRFTMDEILDLYGERISQGFVSEGCGTGACSKL